MAARERTIQSVDRAIALLERLADRGGSASLSDLARDVGLSRSTVHGLLSTLRARGLVVQEGNGHYALGIKLFELGSAAVSRLDLRTAAGPILQHLVDQFQETVHLVVGDGLDVVYIDKRESPRSMRIVSQVGRRLPAYCTAVGKAMLALKPEEELDRLLEGATLRAWTPNTITDKETLRTHLREVRQRGYALDNEEIFEGLCCVGAPIRDHLGQVVAALSVAGPSVRMGPERKEEIIPAVMEAAAEISHRLGYRKRETFPIPQPSSSLRLGERKGAKG
ncbi:MAG: IclR family transcriptional regulator [Anaerolineae bacterium]|nr:IclR family transcriptional regulator [Anaerolineae bacterium]